MKIPDFGFGSEPSWSKNKCGSANKSGDGLLALSVGISLFAVSSPRNFSSSPPLIFTPGVSVAGVVGSGVGVADGVGFGVADGVGSGDLVGMTVFCGGIDALLEVGLGVEADLEEGLVDCLGETDRSVILTVLWGFGDSLSG